MVVEIGRSLHCRRHQTIFKVLWFTGNQPMRPTLELPASLRKLSKTAWRPVQQASLGRQLLGRPAGHKPGSYRTASKTLQVQFDADRIDSVASLHVAAHGKAHEGNTDYEWSP